MPTVRTRYATFRLPHSPDVTLALVGRPASADGLTPAVQGVPGVSSKRGRLNVPANAVRVVEAEALRLGERLVSISPLVERAAPLELRGMRDGIPEWLTEYQREGALFTMKREGSMLLWAAGCLTGDAELVINRRGCARRIPLRDLVHKFNGGASEHPLLDGGVSRKRWRLEFPTFTQSRADDGTLRLNRIVAAIASGRKPTYTITLANGMALRATADHRFLTQRGWVRLGDLRSRADARAAMAGTAPYPGVDAVWVNAGQATGLERAPKPYYPQQSGMPHHPHAQRGERLRADRPGPTRTARVPKHRVSMEAKLSGLTYAAFVRKVRANQLEGLTFLDPTEFAVHHRDENPLNWSPENLVVQTHSEHHRDHALAGKWRHAAFKTGLSSVESIVFYGEEETFDLTMEQPLDNFVANGMVVHNSGKSIGAIAGAQQDARGFVVVVTLAGHKRYWRSEIEHATDECAFVVDGTDPSTVSEGCRYIVVSWEILPAHVTRLCTLPIGCVIFDEAHRMKDHKGEWSKAAQTLGLVADRVIEATATPIPDRPRDLWAQLHVLSPWSMGGFWPYAKRYCGAVEGPFGWDTRGATNQPELKERLRYHAHLVTKKRSHAALPPLRRVVDYIPQAELLADRMPRAEREKVGPARTLTEVKLAAAARRKRPYILDLIEGRIGGSGKIVVLTGRHKDVEELGTAVRRLVGANPRAAVWAVHGANTTGEEREAIVGLKRRDGTYPEDSYMGHPGPCVLIATADTLGTGTNLQDTDLLIMAMLPYSPGQVIQRENRVHRLGGTRRPEVRYLVAEGTIDERVADMLLTKLPAVGALTDDEEISVLSEELQGLADEDAIAASLLRATTGHTED